MGPIAAIQVDAETSLAVIVATSGRQLCVEELNAALRSSPYRVTALHARG